MTHIRPRHAVIVDQQKGVATMFVLFVHEGTSWNVDRRDDRGKLRHSRRQDPRGGSSALRHHSLWPGRRLDRLQALTISSGTGAEVRLGRETRQRAAIPLA